MKMPTKSHPEAHKTMKQPANSPLTAAFFIRFGVVVVVVGMTLWAVRGAGNLNSTSVPGVTMVLPDRVGDFVGTPEEMTEPERNLLPGDTEMVRMRYENGRGEVIVASIVLSGSEKRSIHRPEICLPGQGWSIGAGNTLPVSLASGHTLDVMQLNLSRPVEVQPGVFQKIRSQFLYWFIGKNITTPYHQVRIFKTSWDRVFHRINHRWAYVIVSSIVGDSIRPQGKSAEETTQMLQDFIRKIVPYFQNSEAAGAPAPTPSP